MPDTPDLRIVDEIYRLYHKYTYKIPVSCCKFCADCCTGNVTLTRLEGAYLLHQLSDDRRVLLTESLEKHLEHPRYRPAHSTNGFVRLCREKEPPPEEENLPEWGQCPLLQDDACTIYAVRPFGCRSMMSRHSCRENGEAEIDDFTMTINTVFLQFIEHVDVGGFFGNLTDVLLKLSMDPADDSDGLVTVANQPIPALMVPPEHRNKIAPILNDFNQIMAKIP